MTKNVHRKKKGSLRCAKKETGVDCVEGKWGFCARFLFAACSLSSNPGFRVSVGFRKA